MSTEHTALSQCPIYNYCRTGRDLPPEFCARYRCNTFHQIDTIVVYNKIYEYLGNRNCNGDSFDKSHKVEKELSRIIQQAISEMTLN